MNRFRSPLEFRAPTLVFAAALLLLGGAAVTGPALGSGSSSGGTDTPPPTPEQTLSPEEKAEAAHRSAMESYDKGFEQSEKAQEEMEEARKLKAAGDEKSLKQATELHDSVLKRYKKAIDSFKKSTKLDPGYHEAWNMLGHSYRMTGQMGEAFKAYETCLKLSPDFAQAHEYLGEAWLLAGNVDKAKAELTWLTEKKSEEAPKLASAIELFNAGKASQLGTDW